jgi:DNA-binding NtrC family response regulator
MVTEITVWRGPYLATAVLSILNRLVPLEPGVQLTVPFPRPATTILVVDDERISRRVAYRILTEEGYRVLEAESAPEALDVLSQARGRVDLLILDIVMPDCDGVELGKLVLEEWPDQRILYMSAHPAEVLVEHGLESFDAPFLAKPYSRDEALAKVRQALERRCASAEEPSTERRRRSRLPGK